MMGGYGGGMWFGWMWPVILVMALGVLVWALMRGRPSSRQGNWPQGQGQGGRSASQGRAREILSERYARGEISEEEMRERLRALDGQ